MGCSGPGSPPAARSASKGRGTVGSGRPPGLSRCPGPGGRGWGWPSHPSSRPSPAGTHYPGAVQSGGSLTGILRPRGAAPASTAALRPFSRTQANARPPAPSRAQSCQTPGVPASALGPTGGRGQLSPQAAPSALAQLSPVGSWRRCAWHRSNPC